MRHRFPPFEIDEASGRLLEDGRVVEIQPKVLSLVLHLLRNRDRVVGRAELMEVLWPDETVTEGSLGRAVYGARRVLGDAAVETIRGVGYRFGLSRADDLPERRELPLVGRAGVLAELEEALKDALGGPPRCILLEGPAGIGKSRVLDAFRAWAHERSIEVHSAPGASLRAPYDVWRELFRSFAIGRSRAELARLLGAEAATLRPVLPELGRRMPRAAEPQWVAASARREQLHYAIAGFWRSLAETTSVLLCIDDVHRADAQSLQVLIELCREPGARGIAVVATLRSSSDTEEPLTELRALARRIPVGGLTRDDVAGILEARFGRRPAPAQAQLVLDRTGGNPLFLRELIAQVGTREDGLEQVQRELHLNDDMETAIARHLEDVDTACLEALEFGALVGREFAVATIAGCIGCDREGAARLLEQAVAAAILEPHAGGETRRFTHGMIPEVIARRQSARDRSQRHAALAEALASAPGSGVDHAVALARHRYEAASTADPRLAWEACRDASERLLDADAPEESALWAERAIELLDLGAGLDSERGETFLLAARCWNACGRFDRARGWLRRGITIARATGDSGLFARTAIEMTEGGQTGNADLEGLSALQEAEAGTPPEDRALRASLLSNLSDALIFADPPERTLEVAERALELSRDLDDVTVRMDCLRCGHVALRGPGGLARRRALAAEFRERAERSGRRQWTIDALLLELTDALEAGERETLDAGADEFVRDVEALGVRRYRLYGAFLRGNQLLRRCDLPAAARSIERAVEIGRRVQAEASGQYVATQSYTLCREQGRLGELIGPLRAAASEYPAIPGWTVALALAEWESGERDAAMRRTRMLLAGGLRRIRRDVNWHPTLALLSELVGEFGTAEEAELVLLELKRTTATCMIGPLFMTYQGAAARYRGRLEARAGRLDEAREAFQEAAAIDRHMQAPSFQARAWLDLTRCEREAGRASAARDALTRADALIRSHRLAGLERRAGELRLGR
ncbi:MAG: AAA family ATPase [Myxococcota bacterium]|nr:AAA family ATPase [Myxococcota bacterium]